MKRRRSILCLFSFLFLLVLILPGISEARYGITTNKYVYYAGEPIRIRYSGAPGYNSDWICVVRAGHSDHDAGRNWQWMPRGRHQGYMNFYVSSPGTFEVRAYYNYRRNGYIVSARQRFTVMNKNDYRAYYQTQQPAAVENPEYAAQSWNDTDQKLKQAQYALMERGYDPGSADGVLGARTKTAIRHFQHDNGLAPTGYLNRDTLAALGLLNPAPAPSQQTVAPAPTGQYQDPPQQQMPPATTPVPPPSSYEENQNSQINQPSPPPATVAPVSQDSQPPLPEQTVPQQTASQQPLQPQVSAQNTQVPKVFAPWKGEVVTYTVLLSEPSVMADNLENIPKGALVDVIAELEGFYKVSYNGKEGFIYTNFIKK
jgi:peptidoglycan hydrolase-like protein with peptidoglycan-binding domain